MAAYSGAWKLRAYDDPPRERYQPDPAHGENTPDSNEWVYAAPALPSIDSGYSEYVGLEDIFPLPGIVIDTTPDTHDGPGHPTRNNDQEMQVDSYRAHAENFGASRAANMAYPLVNNHDERQVHTIVEGNGPSVADVINPVAAQRGRNGASVNNPDGFRQGNNEFWRMDRKFYEGERRHDERVTRLNTPAFAGNVPAPTGDKMNPYMSPFNTLARPMTRFFQRPEIRREPKGITQDILTDGSAPESPPLGMYGWGG